MSEAAAGPGTRVGFLGLGRMGQPMAARLAAAGYLITAYDVSPQAGQALAARAPQTTLATTPDEAAAQAQVIVLMLPDSSVVAQVLDGPLGQALHQGQLVVDMSSSEPAETIRHANRLAERGIVLIDAPVSGGVAGAEAGTLTIMTGGADSDVAYVTPLLHALGSRIEHVGATGAGHAVKALNNLMSASNLLAASEAMGIASRFGLDLHRVLDAVNTSTGRSASSEVKWPKFILGGQYDSGFALTLMVKDMRIALQLAEQTGAPSEFVTRAVELWSQAAADLPPGADHTEIARWLENRTNRLNNYLEESIAPASAPFPEASRADRQ